MAAEPKAKASANASNAPGSASDGSWGSGGNDGTPLVVGEALSCGYKCVHVGTVRMYEVGCCVKCARFNEHRDSLGQPTNTPYPDPDRMDVDVQPFNVFGSGGGGSAGVALRSEFRDLQKNDGKKHAIEQGVWADVESRPTLVVPPPLFQPGFQEPANASSVFAEIRRKVIHTPASDNLQSGDGMADSHVGGASKNRKRKRPKGHADELWSNTGPNTGRLQGLIQNALGEVEPSKTVHGEWHRKTMLPAAEATGTGTADASSSSSSTGTRRIVIHGSAGL